MAVNILNLFEIENLPSLNCNYKLLEISGLPRNDNYDKNINLLKKKLAYELRKPIASIFKNNKHYIALPADCPNPGPEQPLTPQVATLIPENKEYALNFDKLTKDTLPIALRFLEFSLSDPLWKNPELWNPFSGKRYYTRIPINKDDIKRDIDIYGGFTYNIIGLSDEKLYISVDLSYKYVDRYFLTEYLKAKSIKDFLKRHFIYNFGNNWYQVQLMGETGQSIRQHKFQDKEGIINNVYDYTIQKCSKPVPEYIQNLDPNSPAIVFKKLGRDVEMQGAAALCKLTYGTNDAKLKALHRLSIRPPTQRFEEIIKIIDRYFRKIEFSGIPLKISTNPIQVKRTFFKVPDQLFGKGHILHVKEHMSDNGVDKRQLGRTRLDFLHDPKIGLFSDSPFDLQYILIPQSLPRSVSENFKEQFTQMIQGFTSHPYKIQTVLYNDIDASNLFKQVKAIKDALSGANVQRGYVLLILPKNTHEDLHNYLKRESWPKFQLQCAMATKILNFYEPISGEITPRYRVKEYIAGKYSSYLRNTALGMLIVNRKWLWALKDALNYDAYIGVDVLNNMAGVSFIYNNAQRCFFRDFPSQQKEKLLSKQIQKIIYDSLKEDIEKHGISPKSVIVHRDGRTYPQEIKGFSTAIQKLKDENLLEKNASTGIVEIHKESSKKLRLVNLTDNGQLNNPTIGTPFIINQLEGIVCNTGWPFNLQGTVKPLHAVIAFGNLDISQVLEDIFSLSQLIWLAPDKCGRLPVTIRLANDFLEPIASESDEDEAIYGEDADEELKEEFEE